MILRIILDTIAIVVSLFLIFSSAMFLFLIWMSHSD